MISLPDSRRPDRSALDARISTEIFVVPVIDRYLVYAPLRKVAFLASAGAVRLVERLRLGPVTPSNDEEAAFVALCARVGLTGLDGDYPIGTLNSAEYRPTDVTLFLTTRCSLRCGYCYASAGDRRRADMSLETARRGIEYVRANAVATGAESFGVGYHGGGEPTSHWDVLVESFEYAEREAQRHGIRVVGSMATNGVLTEDQREWVVRHFRGVNLSVDGIPAVQDRQRPLIGGGSSAAVVRATIEHFERAGFEYGLRLTVTPDSVDDLPAGIDYLLELGSPRHVQVEPVYRLGRGREGAEVEASRFVEAYRAAKAIAEARGIDFFYSAARVDVLTNRFCTSCGEGFSLTPEGLVSACYEVPGAETPNAAAFLIGRYDEDAGGYALDVERLRSLREHTVEGIEWCQGCFAKWHCAGDCAYKTRQASGGGPFRGDDRCDITRALTLDQILDRIARSGGSIWSPGVG